VGCGCPAPAGAAIKPNAKPTPAINKRMRMQKP
jgi:hypothetical protein